MDAGLVAALAGARDAELAALEVDEMHVPHVADAVTRSVIVLLNLSRDQLDRVGEINHIERTLRGGLARHPDTVVVANCDDVLMTSAAYDSPKVVWVAAGGGWANDSVSCPRSGEIIVRDGAHWYSTGTDFKRPTPQWWYDDDTIYGPDGFWRCRCSWRCRELSTAATQLRRWPPPLRSGPTPPPRWPRHRGSTRSRAATAPCSWARTPCGCCWPRTRQAGRRRCRWSTPTPAAVVISVNGQVPDGEDLSWLWDVNFEHFVEPGHPVVAAGERGTDLAVRLGYAGVEHTLVHNTIKAITSCPPGHVEVVANYTAFLQLNRSRAGRPWLTRRCGSGWCCPT